MGGWGGWVMTANGQKRPVDMRVQIAHNLGVRTFDSAV